MRKFGQVNLQQWLQQGIFKNPRNPLKTKGFTPHRSLTTPPHHSSWRWSGIGVVCVVGGVGGGVVSECGGVVSE